MTDFTLVITVPDAKAAEILDTITDHIGFADPSINTGLAEEPPVVITRQAFLRLAVKKILKGMYQAGKQKQAMASVTAATDAADAVDFT